MAAEAYARGAFAECHSLALQAAHVDPHSVEGWLFAGLAASKLGNSDQVHLYLEKAASNEIVPAVASYTYGRMLQAAQHWRALAQLGARLCQNPQRLTPQQSLQAKTWLLLGKYRSGDLDGLAELIEAFLREQPKNPSVAYLYGEVLHQTGRYTEARAAWSSVLGLDPTLRECVQSLARALQRNGDPHGALRVLEKGIENAERAGLPVLALRLECALLMPTIHVDEQSMVWWRCRYVRKLKELASVPISKEEAADIVSNLQVPFFAHYTCDDEVENQRNYAEFVERAVRIIFQEYTAQQTVPPRKRIRVGFYSSFMKQHTIGRLFQGWVTGLDRNRFEVCLYIPNPDSFSRKLGDSVDRFVPVSHSPSIDVPLLRSEGLDVLIFPELGMDARTLIVAAARCAPIQAVAWGHPVTTGLSTVDYYLSSDLMEPPDAKNHYTEQLVRLPGLSLNLEKPLYKNDYQRKREDFGIPESAFVVLCTQSLFKILPENDLVFLSILTRCPDAVLVTIGSSGDVSGLPFLRRFHSKLRSYGINPQKKHIVVEKQSQDDFFALNKCADVVLDGTAWSGGQTTLDALASGVTPVALSTGSFMRMRHTAAILKYLELQDLVADSINDLIEIVIMLWGQKENPSVRYKIDHNKISKLYLNTEVVNHIENWILSLVEKQLEGHRCQKSLEAE